MANFNKYLKYSLKIHTGGYNNEFFKLTRPMEKITKYMKGCCTNTCKLPLVDNSNNKLVLEENTSRCGAASEITRMLFLGTTYCDLDMLPFVDRGTFPLNYVLPIPVTNKTVNIITLQFGKPLSHVVTFVVTYDDVILMQAYFGVYRLIFKTTSHNNLQSYLNLNLLKKSNRLQFCKNLLLLDSEYQVNHRIPSIDYITYKMGSELNISIDHFLNIYKSNLGILTPDLTENEYARAKILIEIIDLLNGIPHAQNAELERNKSELLQYWLK